MNFFHNKLALITGGSSGIGLALAVKLAALGSHVFILARRPEMLDKAIEAIQSSRVSPNQRFGCITADVSDPASVTPLLTQFSTNFGVPDILINSAGVAHPGLFEDLSLDIFEWMMKVNYFGTVNVTKAFIPGMIARGSGYIVNLSSMAGFLGVYGYTAYGASKFAVRGFSDALRAEMKPHGIGVSIVYPPDTQTPQLEYETQYKPVVTKELAGSAKALSPEAVADSILTGIIRRRYTITPGLESTLFYRFSSLIGDLVYPIMDFLIAQSLRKSRVGKNIDSR
jgi:3-dehydrosphinganine reductase